MKNILVFCSHSDDQILGPGGTLSKYAKEGMKIYTIIFSYGENSLPWLNKRYAIKTRVKEAKKAEDIIGGSGVVFLGLKEGKFLEEYNNKELYKKIKRIIDEKEPGKIFTHSPDDPHPDHRAVYKIVIECLDKMRYKCDVFAFDIWNPWTIRKTHLPKLYVDVTSNFKTKIKATKVFKSQQIALFTLLWSVYIRALINGFHIHVKYAERFFKIR